MEFVKELLHFLKNRKKLWLSPLIFILLLLAIFTVIAGSSALGALLYALF